MVHHLQMLPGCFPQHFNMREVHAKLLLNDPLCRYYSTYCKVLRQEGSCPRGCRNSLRDVKARKVLRKSMPSPPASFCGSVQITILKDTSLAQFLYLPVWVVFLSLYKGDQLAMG